MHRSVLRQHHKGGRRLVGRPHRAVGHDVGVGGLLVGVVVGGLVVVDVNGVERVHTRRAGIDAQRITLKQ